MHWYDMFSAYLGPILTIFAMAAHHKITTAKSPVLQEIGQLATGALAAAAPAIEAKAEKVSPEVGALTTGTLSAITGFPQSAAPTPAAPTVDPSPAPPAAPSA